MRLTVLGACGGWPEPGQACSGFLVEYDGFRLLLDAGYGIVPRLLQRVRAAEVDAVFITHGHPDHCADLNPLLRARAMADDPAPPLPVYAPAGALDAVLALDRPGMLDSAYDLRPLAPDLEIGPFRAQVRMLPHWMPDAGIRLSAGGAALAYTGDSGPSSEVVALAAGADLLVAEATHVVELPPGTPPYLTTARIAGQQAAAAGVGRLLLTHLWPGTDPATAVAAAGSAYTGRLGVASAGVSLKI
jgi:ribonuclease BN (tRNA processing enzyme)